MQQGAGARLRSGSSHGTVRQLHAHGSIPRNTGSVAQTASEVEAPAVKRACKAKDKTSNDKTEQVERGRTIGHDGVSAVGSSRYADCSRVHAADKDRPGLI